jgi:hypothetical protein
VGVTFICGGDESPGPRDDCPNSVHDYPLPSGYNDAHEVAGRRLRRRWVNPRCPDCGLYGWRPSLADADATPVPHPSKETDV